MSGSRGRPADGKASRGFWGFLDVYGGGVLGGGPPGGPLQEVSTQRYQEYLAGLMGQQQSNLNIYRQQFGMSAADRAVMLGWGAQNAYAPAAPPPAMLVQQELDALCRELSEPDPITPVDPWYVRAWVGFLRFLLRCLPAQRAAL